MFKPVCRPNAARIYIDNMVMRKWSVPLGNSLEIYYKNDNGNKVV